MSSRPVIGITSYVEPARWGVWDRPAALIAMRYVEHVRRAGGRAVVLPPDDVDADALDRLDGLILAGGADVAAERYGATPHERTVTRPDRDAGELLLLRAALARPMPILGICRGMQLLAVGYGGTLHQHLPEVCRHEGHQPAPGRFGDTEVITAAGSRVAAIVGDRVSVKCYHHQGIADPGSLKVTAWAPDKVIEAVEDPGKQRFVLGVQWHPEELDDGSLFEALTAAAREQPPRRAG